MKNVFEGWKFWWIRTWVMQLKVTTFSFDINQVYTVTVSLNVHFKSKIEMPSPLHEVHSGGNIRWNLRWINRWIPRNPVRFFQKFHVISMEFIEQSVESQNPQKNLRIPPWEKFQILSSRTLSFSAINRPLFTKKIWQHCVIKKKNAKIL